MTNRITEIITPRGLPQVVRFHDQSRVRFHVRHVLACIAMTLHMLGLGTSEGSHR